MDKLQLIRDTVRQWIEDRAEEFGTPEPAQQALEFMHATLTGGTFATPLWWTEAGKARKAQANAKPADRLTFKAAAYAYTAAIHRLDDIPAQAKNGEPGLTIKAAAVIANHAAASVHWPLYTATLDVSPALFPTRRESPQQTVSQTTLLLKIGDNDMMDTTQVHMRLSTILGLLPLLPGSEAPPEAVQTALGHLDKLRMDEELDRCYEALEQNLEFYHELDSYPWKGNEPTSPDELSPKHDGYRTRACRGDAAAARWERYNTRVRQHRYERIAIGSIADLDERVPADHPYVMIAKELCCNAEKSDALKRLAGDHHHRLLIENLKRLTEAALGHAETKTGAMYDD